MVSYYYFQIREITFYFVFDKCHLKVVFDSFLDTDSKQNMILYTFALYRFKKGSTGSCGLHNIISAWLFNFQMANSLKQ